MAIIGAIADATRAWIPTSWQMLLANPGYGEAGLSRSIKTTKYLLFNTVLDPLLEDTTYNPLVIEYVSLLAACRIITSAAEVINNASQSRTMFGDKNSQESWGDRYANLLKHRQELLKTAENLLPYVKDDLSPVNTLKKGLSPLGYYEGLDNALTEDPNNSDFTYQQKLDKNPVERDL